MHKGVFRQGKSPLCLVHRGSFPGDISIDLVQTSVKLIIIIIIEVTHCALVLITCFVFLL